MTRILFFAVIGRICIFILQKFPFAKLPFIGKFAREGGFLRGLLECDLCLGVWVYTVLALVYQLNILDQEIPFLSQLITGAVISFLVWLVRIGFQSQFGVIKLE